MPPPPPRETLSQREARRTRERLAREAAVPEDLQIGGTFHVDVPEVTDEPKFNIESTWFEDLIAEFGQGTDESAGNHAAGPVELDDLVDAFDPAVLSRNYLISEDKGRLLSLSMMIRMYASAVEGVPILNIMFDDKTGDLRMGETTFQF